MDREAPPIGRGIDADKFGACRAESDGDSDKDSVDLAVDFRAECPTDFSDRFGAQDNRLQQPRPCVDAGPGRPGELGPGHDLVLQYVPHRRYNCCPDDDATDLGTFEKND